MKILRCEFMNNISPRTQFRPKPYVQNRLRGYETKNKSQAAKRERHGQVNVVIDTKSSFRVQSGVLVFPKGIALCGIFYLSVSYPEDDEISDLLFFSLF